jgi:two-component system chemotaxis response regulator CheY
MGATVMIVDDALFMRNILGSILRGKGYSVVAEAASGIEAIKKLYERKPDIIILDIILPDVSGLHLLETILGVNPNAKVVICSAIGQENVIQKALGLGASAFIQKPFTPEKLIEALTSLEG